MAKLGLSNFNEWDQLFAGITDSAKMDNVVNIRTSPEELAGVSKLGVTVFNPTVTGVQPIAANVAFARKLG